MTLFPRKENKNIEFKERLISSVHLRTEKKQHLAAQMKFRLDNGDGKAVYIIGVDDEGKVKGLSEFEFEESLNVLKVIARENNAEISKVEKFFENGHLIGRILISRKYPRKFKQYITIGVGGHVHHGKSTLISTLITGEADKNGKNWLYLNVLPHEIEKELSADLHYAVFGFENSSPIHLKNPLDRREKISLISRADKIINFVDTVGHESWIRTTIRGLIGQNIDYSILTIAADDGITHITKEHFGLMLTMNLPVIICITKVDKVGERRIREVEEQVEILLKSIGRIPYFIRSKNDLSAVIDKLDIVVPILRTSAVTLEGYDILNELLLLLPEREKKVSEPFLMFIDRVYNVKGAGTVVSGTIKQGKLKPGSELLLGPFPSGDFRKVNARSIQMHYYPLEEADAGLIVGIALKGVKSEEIERGMILCDEKIKPKAVKAFEANILVLNHPTRIASGYEPVFHGQTISEAVKITLIDKKYLKSGEEGKVMMEFKYKPQFVQVGDRFVFREGKTKGIGTITRIVKYA